MSQDHVFISYSRRDSQGLARALCDLLEGVGLRCWMDLREIHTSSSFNVQNGSAIGSSQVMLVVLSPGHVRSEWMQQEVASAQREGIPILTVKEQGVPLPDNLPDSLRACPCLDVPDLSSEEGRQELMDAVHRVLSTAAPDGATRKEERGDFATAEMPCEAPPSEGQEKIAPDAFMAEGPDEATDAFMAGEPIEAAADELDCSVFAPSKAAQGDTILVQVFAHTHWQAEEAEQQAKEFDEDAERRGRTGLDVEAEYGVRLAFHLLMPGLEVDDPVQQLVWRSRTESVQFGVRVPDDHKPGTVIGTVIASMSNIPIGRVKFKLAVVDTEPSPEERARQAVSKGVHRYQRAFISYARKDRPEVVKRVQMLTPWGIEYFQDILSIDPGERWERKLYKHIDEADIFLLFWSSSSRDSEWVMKEVHYALERKGGNDENPPEIFPVIIEGPPAVEPPPELADLHFDDWLVYFMIETTPPG
ncbi:toll/interleukin-1 receptor domain-containing protein [Planctomycetota bacterium]